MDISEVLFGSPDILMLGKSPKKRRQHPKMILAVDWDVKHHFKQKLKHGNSRSSFCANFTLSYRMESKMFSLWCDFALIFVKLNEMFVFIAQKCRKGSRVGIWASPIGA